jgi:sugar phosphate isomerase/epimerase
MIKKPWLSRRSVLSLLALPAFGDGRTIGLNAGTYGMKSMTLPDALRAIAEIGYDGVEIALMPGWPSVNGKEIRRVLNDTGLALASLMESLSMDGKAETRARHSERLKNAIALAHDLSPGHRNGDGRQDC